MRNVILLIGISFFIFGCSSTKIKVFDYATQSPLADALVYAEKSHYPFAKSTYTSYKTDKNGIVVLDYTPSDVFSAKMGYWHSREMTKGVILLVPSDMPPTPIYHYGDIFITLEQNLSKNDIHCKDWYDYVEFERKQMRDYIKNYDIKHGINREVSTKELSPIFVDIVDKQKAAKK
ncbi:MAG: hypothetical protein IJI37_06190 [Opitutales bacterium]|nr:hypothetical protein [Opitutales bacterium]